jgi:hypothetical protein
MTGYVAEHADDALEWIEAQQAKKRNIYYALNTPKSGQAKKAKKEDLRQLNGYHLDWDLPKGVARDSDEAEALILAAADRLCKDTKVKVSPNVILSGNGVQAVWLMTDPCRATIEAQSDVETINKRLALHFGAPAGTHNSERILRMPGTWNFPDELKRKRGCVPVLAALYATASADVDASTFARLPALDPVAIRATAKRKDYTLDAYGDWSPFRWPDVLAVMPDLPSRLQETLEGDGDHDRSRALYRLINELLTVLQLEGGLAIEEMLDDNDVKKNIAELCWEGADLDVRVAAIMGHVEEHEYGRAQLGYNICRVLNQAADDAREVTPRDVSRIEKRAELHTINTADESDVNVVRATRAFMAWIEATSPKRDLPNKVEAVQGPAQRQPCTVANVREILANAAITPRWDAMRDVPRFFVDPQAGLKGARPERPAFNFARATAGGVEGQSVREVTLILDALTSVGITERRMAEDHLAQLAREAPFHPIEEYATARAWDGVDRYGDVAACLEADDAKLATIYMRTFFRSAVAAVRSLDNFKAVGKGMQISSTVVLVGKQGAGKSTFWSKVTPPNYLSHGRSLQLGQARETDSMLQCLSGMVCPLNEIATSMRRSDLEALKDFQSADTDKMRSPYARTAIAKPRMTVFVGTANEDFQLPDLTGSRRYLVLGVGVIDRNALEDATQPEALQQLYAQAYDEVVLRGLPWWLSDEEDAQRERANVQHRDETGEEAALNTYQATLSGSEVLEWLTFTQVCHLLGIRYTPARGGHLRAIITGAGYRFERSTAAHGKRLRNVFQFPVLPERHDELQLLRQRT